MVITDLLGTFKICYNLLYTQGNVALML